MFQFWVFVFAAAVVNVASPSAFAWDEADEVEVGVEALLAPATGFDDNDNVQVVLHGFLPNTCFTLGRYALEDAGSLNGLRVRQYAIRRQEGLCAEGAALPPHLMMAVPFTVEAPIGRLKAGRYSFEYRDVAGKTFSRSLSVSRAPTSEIDSLPYAAVTNAMTSDVVMENSEIKVTLTGVLNSTCTEIDQVQVLRQLDTFVLLPTVKVMPGVVCAQALIPFNRELSIGKGQLGHNLIHVRSMNGSAINRVVEVSRATQGGQY